MRWRRRLAGLLVVVVMAGACGSGDDGDAGGTDVATATVPSSVPPLADGTIPWVDWPAADEAFHVQQPPRPEAGPDAEPCTAGRLTGRMAHWWVKGDNDEGKPRTTANGLFGFVVVTNTDDVDCTLQGEVPARLLDNGQPVAVDTSHGVNDEARERVTVVTADGGTAQLRLDWSPPYCGPELLDQSIEMDLPDDGGTLEAPVDEPLQPACTQSETHPDLRTHLSSGAFDVVPVETPLDSPLNPVTVAVEPPAGPLRAGERLTYHVTLTNPTDAPIPLDPCPGAGYIEERFSMGSATTEAVNANTLSFLNCVTVDALAPGATRFEMRTEVPSALGPGREYTVTWRLLARTLSPDAGKAGFFTLPVEG